MIAETRTDLHCPGCASPARPGVPHCPGCGIWLAGPQAAELRWIDGELRRVDAARTSLISRRATLLDDLTALRRTAAPSFAAARPERSAGGRPAHAPGPVAAGPGLSGAVPRREVSARAAARLLLAAGAALVVIAVTVFTVADWARIGSLGRCGILLAATAIVLAAPPALIRRGLTATSESVAAIGLCLTVADAFLLGRLIPGSIGPGGAAAGSAALAGLWAAYGAMVRLPGPRIAAIGLAQLILPLVVADLAGFGGPATTGQMAVALVLNSAGDLALACWAGRAGRATEAAASSAAAVAMWTCGVLTAAGGLAVPAAGSAATWTAVALVAGAAVGVTGPRGRLAALARPAAATSGALLALGLALPVIELVHAGWGLAAVAGGAGLVGAAACALARGTSAQPREKAPAAGSARLAARAESVAAGAAAALAGTVLLALPAAAAGMFPSRWPLPAWSAWTPPPAGIAAWPGTPAAVAVLALAAVACILAPVRAWTRPAGLVAGAFAVAALPVAAHLSGWAALAGPAAAAVTVLAVGTVLRDKVLARVVMTASGVLAVSTALRALATPAETIAGLAVLTVAFAAAAALARHAFGAVVSTAGALAGAAGLACAVPLAYGWPARYAAFAALALAAAAAGAATRLRRNRPVHSLVLDLGAGAIALLCAGLTAGRQDEFALVFVVAALVASTTAWLRAGARRRASLIVAALAASWALAVRWQPLTSALLAPARMIAQPWQGSEPGQAGRSSGLAFSVVILAGCLTALVTAAGAWHGRGRASLDAVALALPVVAAPAGVAGAAALAGGLGYWLTVGTLLALTLGLTAWAALGQSPAPAAAALIAAALTVAWALAAPVPTLVVLGCLTAAYPIAAWRARQASVAVAAAALCVVAAGGLAGAAALAAGMAGWHAASIALAVAGLTCLAVTARPASRPALWPVQRAAPDTSRPALWPAQRPALWPARRPALWPARRAAFWLALVLLDAAWCCLLAGAGVTVVEPYTAPAALIALAAGLSRSRRDPGLSSWLAVGPGLALLMLPSLFEVWLSPGWIRPTVLGAVAVGAALAGARTGKQASLIIGVVVAVLDAGHALTPAVLALIHAVPSWIPIAVLGAALLWAGATYEARLCNLRAIRRSLAAMN